jgi:hypothetical protein
MSSRFILHGRRKTTRAASAGSLMALGGSVKQTRTAEALGLREWRYCARRLLLAIRKGAKALRCGQVGLPVPLKLPPALRTNALQARKGVTMSPSNPNTLCKLTGVRGSDILLVSDYTTKEH